MQSCITVRWKQLYHMHLFLAEPCLNCLECFWIFFCDFNFMFTVCRTQQLTMSLCVTLLCSSQIHPVAIFFQTWPSFGQNSGQIILCRLGSLSPSLQQKTTKTDLLRLLFVLMQDWSTIHHAAEPARDRGLFRGLELMIEGNLHFTCWNFYKFYFRVYQHACEKFAQCEIFPLWGNL